MKAADALPSLGPLGAYHANNRYRGGNEILDDLAPDILHILVPRPVPFDEVLDRVRDRADAEYEWIAPYMKDAQQRRTTLGHDLDLLAQILGWAGIVERVGAEVKPDPYERDRLVGGTLQLTTVGRWWLGSTSSGEMPMP